MRAATKLFADLARTHADGRHPALMRKLCTVKVLIIDDWLMAPMDGPQRQEMMELVEERYARQALIITSQRPVDRWHEQIGDPTYADAILDRIVHSAHRLALGGRSLRGEGETQAP